MSTKEEPKPVEYVDYEADPHVSSEIVYFYEGAWLDLAMAVGNKRFIAYIYADGSITTSPRLPSVDGGPALIPTHVRMVTEAE